MLKGRGWDARYKISISAFIGLPFLNAPRGGWETATFSSISFCCEEILKSSYLIDRKLKTLFFISSRATLKDIWMGNTNCVPLAFSFDL